MTFGKIDTIEQYKDIYNFSIEQPEKFWNQQAESFITWDKPWSKTSNFDLKNGKISWFKGGELNASYNCIDRHLKEKGNQTAIIWEGNEPGTTRNITYFELYKEVSKLANAMKSLGIKKGDRVCIYLPMIPEAVFSMLACARIGAIHSVVFGGFSADALRSRIQDSECKLVITADAGFRGTKIISVKNNVDTALNDLDLEIKVIVVKHSSTDISWNSDRDNWYHELMETAMDNCPVTSFDSEHPLFILYTSGSTGKPKGIVHTTGGYLVYAALTHKVIFDYQPEEVFWCTADVGWITGHTYLVYGPLTNGATILMYEGVPAYPTPSRMWEIIDKHNVSTFYTAPTLIRSLMGFGDKYLETSKRSSLKLLGTVGEPINPAAWEWYHKKVGNSKCSIVDTWWQTETGGIMVSPLPNIKNQKPGSAMYPFFGIKAEISNVTKEKFEKSKSGYLTFSSSWPGQCRTFYNDHPRFVKTYFSQYPGYYFSGDAAKLDADNHLWITGRVDDVINVSGHRIDTAEIENILVKHNKVAEAAVVGAKHKIKGECVYAYVSLMHDIKTTENIKKELHSLVKEKLGSFAAPEVIHWAPDLPKTRSGKIMRRILRNIANKKFDDFGDTSTLADPSVVEKLIEEVNT